jgi:putative addiction module component (TIGR02574 family)
MFMSSLLAELSERARQLSPEERAQLAEGLLESLQEWSSPEVEAAWDTEILKRIGEYELGEAALSPAADVFSEARRLTQ